MTAIHFRHASDEEIAACRAALLRNLAVRWPREPEPAPRSRQSRFDFDATYAAPSNPAFVFFASASQDWFRHITAVYKDAAVRPEEGKALCDELVRCGYATIHGAKTFRRGGQFSFLLPTALGKQKLAEARVEAQPVRGDAPHGEGDATHLWYQQKICRHFSGRPGWSAEIEMRLTWKHVDVGVRTPTGAFHAHEVVNQNLEKEKSNFEKDVRDGWQTVCFCVGTAETRNDLRHMLIQAFGEAPIRKHAEFAYLPDFR